MSDRPPMEYVAEMAAWSVKVYVDLSMSGIVLCRGGNGDTKRSIRLLAVDRPLVQPGSFDRAV